MLTSKQRAYLKAQATKLEPVLMIGKGGATPEVVESANEALAARELIKAKVLDNCFEDIRDIAHIVGERTRSDVVVVIGRKFVLFRQNKEKTAFEDLPKK
ncbi:MAG: ribosome assembly RNA-binding protein YhbY [Firmicutes bacterium]|nr:ribosome assembly RNA-binding protein YhbY [Bacillota bacterium]